MERADVLPALRERIGTGRKRVLVPLAFFLYGLILFVFFLVWTFPYRLLEKRMEIALESALSAQVEVARKTFLFPVQIRWEGVSLRFPDRAAPLVFERVEARAELFPLLLKRRGEVTWLLRTAGAEAAGRLQIARRGERLHFRLSETTGRLELADLHKGVSGTLHVRVAGQWGEREMGEGDAEIEGERLSVNEAAGILLPVSPIGFSRLSGRLILKGGRLSLEGFAAQGDQADLSGGGNVLIRNPYSGSLLSFSFRVSPKGSLSEMAAMFLGQPTGSRPLQLSVAGTLGSPQIRLNGIAVN
jgi:type II secretion system protein N